jgi:predicted nucleic acid-binding protein
VKVLDATFLIDYLLGVDETRTYLEANDDEVFVFPTPAYAEALVGEGNGPDESDLEGIQTDLEWGEVFAVDEQTAVTAAEIADEMGPEGPFLSGMDALVAAVGRELDAPIVSADTDLTHEEAKKVVEVEEYR